MSGYADGWTHGRPETACGQGSRLANTVSVREALPRWVAKYGIESIADAGAGDLNWISTISLGCPYVGYDIYPRHHLVTEWDIRKKALPPAHAILCRHVLNHMNEADALTALNLMRESCVYFIANCRTGAWRGTPKGSKIPEGHFNEYDLIGEPFNLGEPLESVDDCRGQLAIWRV